MLFYQRVTSQDDETSYFEIKFFHADLGERAAKMDARPGSDLAEVLWVPWSQVKRLLLDLTLAYYYQDLRINQSNALLIDAVFRKKPIYAPQVDAALIIESYQGELLVAIKNDRKGQVDALVRKGIDLNKTRALVYACELDNRPMVNHLIRLGANINQGIYYQNFFDTPLLQAVAKGHALLAIHLIEKQGADINIAQTGVSALALACINNDMPLINYLLNRSVVLKQGVGGTALLATIMTKNYKLAQRLLAMQQIDLNHRYALGQCTKQKVIVYPLNFALSQGAYEFAELFIQAGASLYTLFSSDNTIFQFLAKAFADTELDQATDLKAVDGILDRFFQKFQGAHAAEKTFRQAIFPKLVAVTQLVVAKFKESPHPFYETDVAKLEQLAQKHSAKLNAAPSIAAENKVDSSEIKIESLR